jgi:Trk-type K+ transport system membrane component
MNWFRKFHRKVYEDRPIHPDTLRFALWAIVFSVLLFCAVLTCLKKQF